MCATLVTLHRLFLFNEEQTMTEATSPTSFTLKEVTTFTLKVELAIPPENPRMKGFLSVEYFVMSKDDVKQLGEEGLEDAEYFAKLVSAVHGLAGVDGQPLIGIAALDEVRAGKYSMWLVPAIIQAYFEQYGEARRKNSKGSSRR
jgi:hypothetical protein